MWKNTLPKRRNVDALRRGLENQPTLNPILTDNYDIKLTRSHMWGKSLALYLDSFSSLKSEGWRPCRTSSRPHIESDFRWADLSNCTHIWMDRERICEERHDKKQRYQQRYTTNVDLSSNFKQTKNAEAEKQKKSTKEEDMISSHAVKFKQWTN